MLPLRDSQGGIINTVASYYRLQGLCLHRINRSRTTWVKITPEDFVSCTGLSRRQFFYAKKRLQGWKDCKVIFRTVLRKGGRGWSILVSCRASHLYSVTTNGMGRKARINLRDSRCPSPTECNHYRGQPTVGRNITSTLRDLKPSSGQIRLAHFIKRDLEAIHWDNCKVNYNPGMAFVYASEMIALSHDASRIVASYEIALSHFHGVATDCGERFALSSTVCAARSLLGGLPLANRSLAS